MSRLILPEEFPTARLRNYKYKKHNHLPGRDDEDLGYIQFELGRFKDEFEYEHEADVVAGDPTLAEYIQPDEKHVKFDSTKNELVVFIPDEDMKSGNRIITMFPDKFDNVRDKAQKRNGITVN